ncbi:MAG: ferritin-like protein [Halioglobus sp.]
MKTDSSSDDHNFGNLIAQWREIEQAGEPLDHERGMAWLASALRAAVKLEFSTIPPYLCALWSIKDQASQAASSIRHIVQEEMLHMSLACNMLVALGEEYSPGISDPDFAPSYPGELAGGVHKGLQVKLEGFSDNSLRTFLAIELPEMVIDHAVSKLVEAEKYAPAPSGDVTIGELYDLVDEVFGLLQPELHLYRQVTGPLVWFPITTLDDVHKAISLITDQGEGSSKSPLEYQPSPGQPLELSHFYRFLELKENKKIIYLEDEDKWGFGEDLERPDCYPMAAVPPGGYSSPGAGAPQRVVELCADFNCRYKLMLHHLNAVWEQGDQGELVHAIEHMFALKEVAQALMSIPVPTGDGATYGPDFRVDS